ncbi:MAG: sodium ion-translocating decarboxylase subunit beta, partial [Dethiobacteria bacterium]|nr:sodium ion-translocating decarboxylase subunit beta [Dethiobacteria bacterium]
MIDMLIEFMQGTGFYNLQINEVIMIIIASVLLYLGIAKKYEPLLLVPISFGILLVNLPLGGLVTPGSESGAGGLFYYLSLGLELGIYPPLIFLGVGAMTDFGPLIANPITLLL